LQEKSEKNETFTKKSTKVEKKGPMVIDCRASRPHHRRIHNNVLETRRSECDATALQDAHGFAVGFGFEATC
jgi:hypothetical protein